jgi:hypothetical protein
MKLFFPYKLQLKRVFTRFSAILAEREREREREREIIKQLRIFTFFSRRENQDKNHIYKRKITPVSIGKRGGCILYLLLYIT